MTLVSGEEEVQIVAGTDEELGHLGPVVNPNQRRGVRPPVSNLQGVVVDLRLKPTK